MTDGEFAKAVAGALQMRSRSELADALRVSIPTILRWARGVNLPHARLRASIFAVL